MFTSFGYFEDEREDVAVLRNLFASLKPGGVCLIDVSGKETLLRVYRPTTSVVLRQRQLTSVTRSSTAGPASEMRILIRRQGDYSASM
jgi:hypothetical protein